MRGIRLVASDLDGTLLLPDETVSERTRAALAAAKEAGITVVLVSGRQPRSLG
ncbi:MAG TPA: HAD hydrolase family protein, partial [Actinomycetes bacterium]|nr:HAD hydrolase family protein [Actinomycetes bacterium]